MFVIRKSDLYEEVDGYIIDFMDLGFYVFQVDVEVFFDVIFSNFIREVDIEQIFCVDLDIFFFVEKLICGRYVFVEYFSCNVGQCRMCYLSIVMVSFYFMQFISFDVIYGFVVGSFVIFDGDLGSYVIYGVDVVVMVGFDEEFDVGVYEGDCYSDGRVVRKNEMGVLVEFFDDVEDVVLVIVVEIRVVVMEFVDDFIYFESSYDGFNQDSFVDSFFSYVNVILGKVEGIVLEMGFEVRFYFGEVEVWVVVVFDSLEGIVIEVEIEVEERGGYGGVVDGDVFFVEVLVVGVDDQSGQGMVGVEFVFFGVLFEVDLVMVGVVEVDLVVNYVVLGWGVGVWDGCQLCILF